VNFRSDSLIQSQKWSVGFGPYGEIVVCGINAMRFGLGRMETPLTPWVSVLLTPDMPLDWVSNGVEDEDPSFAILDAIEENFHRVKKGARLKSKGGERC